MQKKSFFSYLPFLSLLLVFMLMISCSNPVVQQSAVAPGGESAVSRALCLLPPWQPGPYSGSQEVCHNGFHWRAKWWTMAEPGVNSYAPWVKLGPCPGLTPNSPPQVKILQPVNGLYELHKPLEILVDATDDKEVVKVEVHVGGILMFAYGKSGPYRFEWTPTVQGNFVIQASAYDNEGAISKSQVEIRVLAKPARLPVVKFTAPVDGTDLIMGKTIELAVDVSSDDPIEKVEFFLDNVMIGVDLEAPYSLPWTPDLVGTFKLVAIATNIYSGPGISPPVTVKVETFTPPVNEWSVGINYLVGDLVVYNGRTWRCILSHTANPAWPPGTPGIWL